VARVALPLVPAIVDLAPDAIVVAAGGIGDGRGLAAALMLGAEGVLMGTRFYASREAAAHPDAKAAVQRATGDRTIRGHIFDIARKNIWPEPFTGRVLCNRFSDEWAGREGELLRRQEEVSPLYAEARAEYDFDIAAVFAGEVADLIRDIPPAGEIVERMAAEAAKLLAAARDRYRIAP
jgi:nitronate monooxygenase